MCYTYSAVIHFIAFITKMKTILFCACFAFRYVIGLPVLKHWVEKTAKSLIKIMLVKNTCLIIKDLSFIVVNCFSFLDYQPTVLSNLAVFTNFRMVKGKLMH